MSGTVDYAGDPHIGVFSRIIHDIAVVPPDAPESFIHTLQEELEVEPVLTTIQDSSLIGPLLTGNRQGMVVSGLVTEREHQVLREYGEIMRLSGPATASGNMILVTDSFAAIHPEMDPALAEEIGDFLKAKVVRMTLGGIKTVGMAAAATNRGILVHPRTTNQEMDQLEAVSGLPVGRGSVNLGSGLIGTGLVVNERGYLAGFQTSGFELGRIEEVFGFME